MSEDAVLVGFGRSHRALLRHLLSRGYRVRVLDQKGREDLDAEALSLLEGAGVSFVGGPGYLTHIGRPDLLFLTPGMPKHAAEVEAARREGVRVTGEASFVLEHYDGPVIGITGSSGKTTTTTLVGALLQASGVDAVVAGNIGRPLVEVLGGRHPAWLVAELSSFQLETATVSPTIAAILNFAPNHLDVHPSLEDYFQAKLNIMRFQGPGDSAVLPFGDDALLSAQSAFAGHLLTFGGPARDEGAFEEGDELVVQLAGERHSVAAASRMKMPGRHNRRNVLAAALMALTAGGRPEVFPAVAEGFPGVPHRLERVAEKGGVLFVNDSIATAPDRTVAALQAMERPVILLAGGYDKGLDYAPLAGALSGTKLVVAYGKTGPRVAEVARLAGVPVREAENLEQALAYAVAEAVAGDVVLLSPASASYDQFTNFEARGEAFRQLVGAL